MTLGMLDGMPVAVEEAELGDGWIMIAVAMLWVVAVSVPVGTIENGGAEVDALEVGTTATVVADDAAVVGAEVAGAELAGAVERLAGADEADEGFTPTLDDGAAELDTGGAELDTGGAELDTGGAELDTGGVELDTGGAELDATDCGGTLDDTGGDDTGEELLGPAGVVVWDTGGVVVGWAGADEEEGGSEETGGAEEEEGGSAVELGWLGVSAEVGGGITVTDVGIESGRLMLIDVLRIGTDDVSDATVADWVSVGVVGVVMGCETEAEPVSLAEAVIGMTAVPEELETSVVVGAADCALKLVSVVVGTLVSAAVVAEPLGVEIGTTTASDELVAEAALTPVPVPSPVTPDAALVTVGADASVGVVLADVAEAVSAVLEMTVDRPTMIPVPEELDDNALAMALEAADASENNEEVGWRTLWGTPPVDPTALELRVGITTVAETPPVPVAAADKVSVPALEGVMIVDGSPPVDPAWIDGSRPTEAVSLAEVVGCTTDEGMPPVEATLAADGL
jgi:hypothetical protein